MLFVGVDWAEDHHDVCVMAEDGTVLGKRRVPDSVAGIGELHGLVAEQHRRRRADRRRHRGRPRSGGLVVADGRLRGLRRQPDGVGSLSGPPRNLGGQVRSRRRQGAGRSGAHRPAQPSTHCR